MSNIPVAREKLELVAKILYSHAIDNLQNSEATMLARAYVLDALDLMHRKQHKEKRASRKSRRITAEVREAIKSYHEMVPDESTSKIAQVFEVNQGRVSEVLAGKYDKLS